MRVLAACLLALSFTNAIPRDFTARDAETLAAAARANARDPSSQEVIKLAREMGAARNLDALDAMLALRHAGLVGTYSRAFLDGNRGRPAPAIEERLLRHYDDPRLAVSLLWALDRYESPALFERLLDDVARFATRSREQTRLCRFVGREPPSSPPFGLGVSKRQVYLDCPPSLLGGPEVFRADNALRLIGNTALPGIESRVSIHIADLVSVPPADPGVVPEDGHSLGASRVFALASIARLLGERRYTPGVPALIAALGGLTGDSRQDVGAAMPLLVALGEMDLREGSETIARWIERRSRGRFPINESPRLLDMIRLLAGVLPEGQIDVEPLRDRVLANVPQAAREEHASAFRGVINSNRGLREVTVATLTGWASANKPRLVRYALAKGAPLDAIDHTGNTPLTAAVWHFDMQRLLTDAGARPDMPRRDGMTPFHIAVERFNMRAEAPWAAVEFFRARGADVNALAEQGAPLHTAVHSGSVEMVRYLIANGARVNLKRKDGLAPLHVAVGNRNVPIATALLKNGADVNAMANQGTPLHTAVRAGSVDMVRFLLDHGANVNAKQEDQVAPLHIAVVNGNVPIAGVLLERGAEVNAEIDGGLTPLLIAWDTKNVPMQELLARNGGRINKAYVDSREVLRR